MEENIDEGLDKTVAVKPDTEAATPVGIPAPVPHPIASDSIYPNPTSHLPGNAAMTDNTAREENASRMTLVDAPKVHHRVQSLFFYTSAALLYGLWEIFFYTIGYKGVQEVLPIITPSVVQHIALAASFVSLACIPILFTSRNIRTVQGVLYLQLIGYAVVFVAAYIAIIMNFNNFFLGTGLLAVTDTFFTLWTHSVLREVGTLPG